MNVADGANIRIQAPAAMGGDATLDGDLVLRPGGGAHSGDAQFGAYLIVEPDVVVVVRFGRVEIALYVDKETLELAL